MHGWKVSAGNTHARYQASYDISVATKDDPTTNDPANSMNKTPLMIFIYPDGKIRLRTYQKPMIAKETTAVWANEYW